MKLSKSLLFSLSLVLAMPAAPQTASSNVAASAPTAVPPLIPYSGVVGPVSGQQSPAGASVTFLIYKDAQGGEPLFAETQTVAVDSTGHYKAQLGATLANGIPMDLFANGEARWLEVQIAGEPAKPRVLLVSVPYALKAADAATLGGLPASAFVLAGAKSSPAAGVASAAITPGVAANVTTPGGITGYIPEFSGASTIVDSPIFVLGASVGIGTATPTAPLTVSGNTVLNGAMTVNGDATFNGPFVLPPPATATANKGYNSQFIKLEGSAWNSATSSAVSPRFQWVNEIQGNNTAAPTATLNLQSSTTTAAPTETGFHFNANGTLNFAPGQTFPGAGITGTVNASGYDLGGSSFATGSASSGNAYLGFAGNASSSGIENTGTGYRALASDTSGSNNTATGYEVLNSNTTGSNNTATGHDALFNNSIGIANTAVGYLAGPDSGSPALTNSTALGANATVSQSNSLVLGTTTAGSPGAAHVNVGIGTATPRSVLEASVGASGALGPALTLTNTAGGLSAAASIDFNTYYHPAVPYHNPTSRIEAVDDNNYGNSLIFLSKTDGADSNGLQTNMEILSTGGVLVLGQSSGSDAPSFGIKALGGGATGGFQGANGGLFYGGNVTGADGGDGLDGAGGSSDIGYGGDGGYFIGGNTSWVWNHAPGPTGGTGGVFQGGEGENFQPGDGIYVTPGPISKLGFPAAAAVFNGEVDIAGTLNANVKNFKIDHPLDPANKYLVHSSVESSEMMNIYSGNVVTDELGLATIKLPDWFEAENIDFRYQLTVIGQFAQAIIKDKIANGQFRIMTNASHVEVSWQITAVRQDAYAKAHPLVVEQQKPERERGFYQNPELYGQPAEKQTEWGRRPQQMQHMKQMQEQQRLRAEQHQASILSDDQPGSAVNNRLATPEGRLSSKSDLDPATPPIRN